MSKRRGKKRRNEANKQRKSVKKRRKTKVEERAKDQQGNSRTLNGGGCSLEFEKALKNARLI